MQPRITILSLNSKTRKLAHIESATTDESSAWSLSRRRRLRDEWRWEKTGSFHCFTRRLPTDRYPKYELKHDVRKKSFVLVCCLKTQQSFWRCPARAVASRALFAKLKNGPRSSEISHHLKCRPPLELLFSVETLRSITRSSPPPLRSVSDFGPLESLTYFERDKCPGRSRRRDATEFGTTTKIAKKNIVYQP